MHHTPKSFRGARTCSRSSITVPSLVWLGFHPPPGGQKRWFLTGSIARRAKRPLFKWLRGRFWGFSHRRGTRCTDGSEIWHGGGNQRSPPPCQISPHWCNDKGIGPHKLKLLLRFDQNVEHKCSAGACHLRDFHKICRVCTQFHDTLGVKISLDLLKGLCIELWEF